MTVEFNGRRINRYSYKELRERAVSLDATKDDLKALAIWFERWGVEDRSSWNGESWDIDDGYRLYPISEEVYEGEFQVVGYEIH